MKKIRSFKCPDGCIFDRMVTDDIKTVKCECGETANRIIFAARYFSNSTGKSPSVR